jgi:uncharacterized protein
VSAEQVEMTETGDHPPRAISDPVSNSETAGTGELPLWGAIVAAPLILGASIAIAAVFVGARQWLLPAALNADTTLWGLIEAITSQMLIVVLVIALLLRARGEAVQWLLLDRPIGRSIVYLGCFGTVLAIVGVYNALLYFAVGHDPLTDLWPFAPLIGGRWWWVALIVIGFGAPLSEEILFRGFLLSAFRRASLGFWPSAIITTALWTILHFSYSIIGLVEVFIVGMVFSAMVRWTGSLRPALFCHAAYNAGLVLGLRWWLH